MADNDYRVLLEKIDNYEKQLTLFKIELKALQLAITDLQKKVESLEKNDMFIEKHVSNLQAAVVQGYKTGQQTLDNFR